MVQVLTALVWIVAASIAGLTPNRWHRPIAYSLIAVIPFIAWTLFDAFNVLAAFLFVCVCIYQLRLLLLHWLKRALSRKEPVD